MRYYIFHFFDFSKQTTALYSAVALSVEHAFSLLGPKLGKQLERSEDPTAFLMEKSDPGPWKTLEAIHVRVV